VLARAIDGLPNVSFVREVVLHQLGPAGLARVEHDGDGHAKEDRLMEGQDQGGGKGGNRDRGIRTRRRPNGCGSGAGAPGSRQCR